ncbi:MAG: hypothetical protein KGJ23_16140 [Euryarchaeota archaeon]|nr:hypothetical protein [Euryarchaeota archaeon]MDE1838129.1 hypothetical protein [Euryarchaeota archaeon]MDE1880342.1 hypothetical protein [Euryarchaeota archaeon]MDE2046605.1 hypothetical protein [Thermoplasmata archaeon]
MSVQPLQPEGDDLEVLQGLGDTLLERAVELYSELRLVKRPPESARGAERKTLRWLEDEAARLGRDLDPAWVPLLQRAFLEIEGDVAEAAARRRFARHATPGGAGGPRSRS